MLIPKKNRREVYKYLFKGEFRNTSCCRHELFRAANGAPTRVHGEHCLSPLSAISFGSVYRF